MLNKIIGIAIAAGATVVLTLTGVDIYEHHQVAKKVDKSVNELEKSAIKDIQQGMIQRAVEDAAGRSVTEHLNRIKNEVFAEARVKLSEEVRAAVKEAGDVIRREVGEKISSEASMIDIGELKKSARDKAEQKILDKFDGNLEDLLAKFNDNLGNIQKIYGGIADAISKGQEQNKGLKFTIG